MRKILLGIAATAVIATPLAATAANAATLDSTTGAGFVGKGEVQSAFSMNNKGLQDAVNANPQAFTFTTSQGATQALKSTASQVVTEHGTQTVHRDLSCTVTVGGVKNPIVFHNDGSRNGTQTGTQAGTRVGDRTGTLTGKIAAAINADPRKTGQWTGWNLYNYVGKTFNPTAGSEDFDAPEYGTPSFPLGWQFDDVEWSGWVADGGAHPSDCDRNDSTNDGKDISDLNDVTTYGDVVVDETATEFGDETFGVTDYLGVTPVGAASLSVTYKDQTKPLTIAVPAV